MMGGSRIIGSNTMYRLHREGHEVKLTSTGINTVSAEGLPVAFADAQVVVNLTN
ncbi:hypothetical protein GCM10007874_59570 [Labrys miyagiensis]|uniref:Uncharacterized protein n=1 Tax=Labrys miyagiensis TaxID=346912 RepID=A0ABQ6CRG6_9HYPH|nr:hypothetical protein GCM10007874_59570 [Labrys miyagiensis]